MFLFASKDVSTLIISSYPPLGVVSIAFMGIASYLLLVGIHSSALSVANDIELRRSIKESVRHESNLLGNIGSAQMESVLQNRVMKVVRFVSNFFVTRKESPVNFSPCLFLKSR
jgi:hypothetical protein